MISSEVICKVLRLRKTYKFSIDREVVKVFVEQISEKIQVFAILNDLLCIFDDFSEAVHNLLTILLVMTVIQ